MFDAMLAELKQQASASSAHALRIRLARHGIAGEADHSSLRIVDHVCAWRPRSDGGLVFAKSSAKSPRWLESVGRKQEAGAILQGIELEVALHQTPLQDPVATPASSHSRGLTALLSPVILPRLIVGSVTLIVVNTLVSASSRVYRRSLSSRDEA